MGKLIYQGKSEAEVRKMNKEDNLIKHKKVGSLTRVMTPIFRRLRVMTPSMLDLFLNEDIDTSKMILLYSIMKTDDLFYDFVKNVYYENIMNRKECIYKSDVDSWYENKIYESENLKQRSDKTNYKLKQVIIRIMIDAGLLIKEEDNKGKNTKYKINIPILRQTFIDALYDANDIEYASILGGKKI